MRARVNRGDNEPVTAIQLKRRGCPLLIGELDEKVWAYVHALRDAGGSVGSCIVITAAEGIVTATDRTMLEQHGGHIY